MKLAIVGSRTFNDYKMLIHYIDVIIGENEWDEIIIISGGAQGADNLAKKYCEPNQSNIPYKEFSANWDKYGKSAGFKRNQQIVDACDMVLAFWDGKSKGTQDTINKAKIAKKPTFIIYF